MPQFMFATVLFTREFRQYLTKNGMVKFQTYPTCEYSVRKSNSLSIQKFEPNLNIMQNQVVLSVITIILEVIKSGRLLPAVSTKPDQCYSSKILGSHIQHKEGTPLENHPQLELQR